MTDLVLAIAHHLLVFGLVAMLAMELAIARGVPVDVARLSRLDGGYGAAAGLILIVGGLRAVLGARGWAFYQDNPFFWAKMAAFLAVGLLSVPPTLAFRRWSRSLAADPRFQPPPGEIAGAVRWLRFELLLVLTVVAFAAAMARYPF